jgi:hypothetical protein
MPPAHREYINMILTYESNGQLYKTRVEDTINIIAAADTEFRALVSRSNLPCCDLRSVAQLPGVFSSLRPVYHVLAKTGRKSLIDEDAMQQLRVFKSAQHPMGDWNWWKGDIDGRM